MWETIPTSLYLLLWICGLLVVTRLILPRYIPWFLSRLFHSHISHQFRSSTRVHLSIGDSLTLEWQWPWEWYKNREKTIESIPLHGNGVGGTNHAGYAPADICQKKPITVHLVRPTLRLVLPSVQQLRDEQDEFERTAPTDYTYVKRLSHARTNSSNGVSHAASAKPNAPSGLSVGAAQDVSPWICSSLLWRLLRWVLTCVEFHITEIQLRIEESEQCVELTMDGVHVEGARFRPDGSIALARATSGNQVKPELCEEGVGLKLGWLALQIHIDPIVAQWKPSTAAESSGTSAESFAPNYLLSIAPCSASIQLPVAAPAAPNKDAVRTAIEAAIGRARVSLHAQGIASHLHTSDIPDLERLARIFLAAKADAPFPYTSRSTFKGISPSASTIPPPLNSPPIDILGSDPLRSLTELASQANLLPTQISLQLDQLNLSLAHYPRPDTGMDLRTPQARVRGLSGSMPSPSPSPSPTAPSGGMTTLALSFQHATIFCIKSCITSETTGLPSHHILDINSNVPRINLTERILRPSTTINQSENECFDLVHIRPSQLQLRLNTNTLIDPYAPLSTEEIPCTTPRSNHFCVCLPEVDITLTPTFSQFLDFVVGYQPVVDLLHQSWPGTVQPIAVPLPTVPISSSIPSPPFISATSLPILWQLVYSLSFSIELKRLTCGVAIAHDHQQHIVQLVLNELLIQSPTPVFITISTPKAENVKPTLLPISLESLSYEVTLSSLELICTSPYNTVLTTPLFLTKNCRASTTLHLKQHTPPPMIDLHSRRRSDLTRAASEPSLVNGFRNQNEHQITHRRGIIPPIPSLATSSSSSTVPSDWCLDISIQIRSSVVEVAFADWLNDGLQHFENAYIVPFPHLLIHQSPVSPSSSSAPPTPTIVHSASLPSPPLEHHVNNFDGAPSYSPFIHVDVSATVVVPVIVVALIATHRSIEAAPLDPPYYPQPFQRSLSSQQSLHLLTIHLSALTLHPSVNWTRATNSPRFQLHAGSGLDFIRIRSKHMESFSQFKTTLDGLTSTVIPSDQPPFAHPLHPSTPCLVEIGKIILSRLPRTSSIHGGIPALRPTVLGMTNRMHVSHATIAWDTVQHVSIVLIQVSMVHFEQLLTSFHRRYAPPSRKMRADSSAGTPVNPVSPQATFTVPPHAHPHPESIATSDAGASSISLDTNAVIIEEDDELTPDSDRERDLGDSSSSSSDGEPISTSYNGVHTSRSRGSKTLERKKSKSKSKANSKRMSRSKSRLTNSSTTSEDGAVTISDEEVIEPYEHNDPEPPIILNHSRSVSRSRSKKSKLNTASTTETDDPTLAHASDLSSSSSASDEGDEFDSSDEVEEKSLGEDEYDLRCGPIALELSFVEFLEKTIGGHSINLAQAHVLTFITEFMIYGQESATELNEPSKGVPIIETTKSNGRPCPYPLLGTIGLSSLRFGRREIFKFQSLSFGGCLGGTATHEPDVALFIRFGVFNLPWDVEFGAQYEMMLTIWKALKRLKRVLIAQFTPHDTWHHRFPAVLGIDPLSSKPPEPSWHYPFPDAEHLDVNNLWISAPGFIFSMDDSAIAVRERHERQRTLSAKQRKEEAILRRRFRHEELRARRTSVRPRPSSNERKASPTMNVTTEHVDRDKNAPFTITHVVGPQSPDAASPSPSRVHIEDARDSDDELADGDTDDADDLGDEYPDDDIDEAKSHFSRDMTPLRRTTPFYHSPPSVITGAQSVSIPSTMQPLSTPFISPQRYSLFSPPKNLAATPSKSNVTTPRHASLFTSPASFASPDRKKTTAAPFTHSRRQSAQLFDVHEQHDRPFSATNKNNNPGRLTPEPILEPEPIPSPSSTFTLLLDRSGAGDAQVWLTSCATIHQTQLEIGSAFDFTTMPGSDAAMDCLFHVSLDLKLQLIVRHDLLDPWKLRQKVHELDSTTRTPYAYDPTVHPPGEDKKHHVHAPWTSPIYPTSSSSSSNSFVYGQPVSLPLPTGYFTELWARDLFLHGQRVSVHLRDYPVPLISTPELLLSGLIIPGQLNCPTPFIKHHTLQLSGGILREELAGESKDEIEAKKFVSEEEQKYAGVTPNKDQPKIPHLHDIITIDYPSPARVPLKLYHDLTLEMVVPHISYGPCLLRTLDLVSDGLSRMTAPPDPNDFTPKLPWWDKARFIVHGNLAVKLHEFEFRFLSNVQPYIPSFIHLTGREGVIKFSKGHLSFDVDDLSLSCVIHESEWSPIANGIHFLPGMPNPLLWRQYAQGRFLFVPKFEMKVALKWVGGGRVTSATKKKDHGHGHQHAHHAHNKAILLDTVEELSPPSQDEAMASAAFKQAQESHYVHHEWILARPHANVFRTPPFSSKRVFENAVPTHEPNLIHTVFDLFVAQDLNLVVNIGLNPPAFPCLCSKESCATTLLPQDETLTNIPYITGRWWAICWIQDVYQLYANVPQWLEPPRGPNDRSFGSVFNTIQLSLVMHAARGEFLKQELAQSGGMSLKNGMKDLSGILICVGHLAIDANYLAQPHPTELNTRNLILQEPAMDILQASAHILVPLSHKHAAHPGSGLNSLNTSAASDHAHDVHDTDPNHIVGLSQDICDATAAANAINNTDPEIQLRRLSSLELDQRQLRRRGGGESDGIVNFIDQSGKFVSPFDKSMDGKVGVFLCSLRLLAFRSHSSSGPNANPWTEPSAEEQLALTQQATTLTKDLPFSMSLRLPPKETKWEEWFSDLVQIFDEDEELDHITHTGTHHNDHVPISPKGLNKAMDRLGIVAEDLKINDLTSSSSSGARETRSYSIGVSSSSPPPPPPPSFKTPPRNRGLSLSHKPTLPATRSSPSPATTRRHSELRHARSESVNALIDAMMVPGQSAKEVIESLRSPSSMKSPTSSILMTPQGSISPPIFHPEVSDSRARPTGTAAGIQLNIIPPTPPLHPVLGRSPPIAGASFMLATPMGRLPCLRSIPTNSPPLTSPCNSTVYGVTRGRSAPSTKLIEYSSCSFRNLVVNLKVLWSTAIKTAWRGLMTTVESTHPSMPYRHQLQLHGTLIPNPNEFSDSPEAPQHESKNPLDVSTASTDDHRQHALTDDDIARSVHPYFVASPRQRYSHPLSPLGSHPHHALPHAQSVQLYHTPNGSFSIATPIGGSPSGVIGSGGFGHSHGLPHSASVGNSPYGQIGSTNNYAHGSLTPMTPAGAPYSPYLHSNSPPHTGIVFTPRISYDMDQLLREVDLHGTIEADDRVDQEPETTNNASQLFGSNSSSSGLRRAPTRRERVIEWSTLFELDCIRPQINFQNPSSSSRLILSAARARLESHGLPVLFDIEQHFFGSGGSSNEGLFVNTSTGSISASHANGSSPLHQPFGSNSISYPYAGQTASNQRFSVSQSTDLPLNHPMQPIHKLSGGGGGSLNLGSPRPYSGSMGSFNIGPPATSTITPISPVSNHRVSGGSQTMRHRTSSTSAEPTLSLDQVLAPLYFEKKVFTSLQSAQMFVVPPDIDIAGSLTWVGDTLISDGVEPSKSHPPTAPTSVHSSPLLAPTATRSVLVDQPHSANLSSSTLSIPPSIQLHARSATPPRTTHGNLAHGAVTLPTLPGLSLNPSRPVLRPSQASHLQSSRNVLRRIMQPTTLHYCKMAQQDIDDELLRRGLGVLDDLNGIVAWLNEVKSYQRNRIRATSGGGTRPPNAANQSGVGGAKLDLLTSPTKPHAPRSSLFHTFATSNSSVSPEPFVTDLGEKRVLRDSIQLFLPALEAHMDSAEFSTLISVVQSVLLSLNDEKKRTEADAAAPIPPLATKQDIQALQTIIESVLDTDGSAPHTFTDVLLSKAGMGGVKTPAKTPMKTSATATPNTVSGVISSQHSNGPIVKSRVQYYLGQVSWEMLKHGSGFIRQSLTGMFGDHVFFHDLSVGIHASIQHMSFKSCLLPPGEKQHYHHLVRPDPVLWQQRDTKRDMMMHMRALIREPLGDKNPLLHYVTAYEHFELTFFPLVVCLPHDHALMLRDYFLPELDAEHVRAKAEAETKYGLQAKEKAKSEKEKEKELKESKESNSKSIEEGATLHNPKEAHGLRPSRTQIGPSSTESQELVLAENKKLNAALPAIKYFKYIRINSIDFTFSFKHETRSIFTFENVHLLVSPYTKSKRQYTNGWSELFQSIEKHIIYNVISHGTEILAQKMGIGHGPQTSTSHEESTRALLSSTKDEYYTVEDGVMPTSSASSISLDRKKKEVSFGKKLLGIFSRGLRGKETPEEQERRLKKESEKREKKEKEEKAKEEKLRKNTKEKMFSNPLSVNTNMNQVGYSTMNGTHMNGTSFAPITSANGTNSSGLFSADPSAPQANSPSMSIVAGLPISISPPSPITSTVGMTTPSGLSPIPAIGSTTTSPAQSSKSIFSIFDSKTKESKPALMAPFNRACRPPTPLSPPQTKTKIPNHAATSPSQQQQTSPATRLRASSAGLQSSGGRSNSFTGGSSGNNTTSPPQSTLQPPLSQLPQPVLRPVVEDLHANPRQRSIAIDRGSARTDSGVLPPPFLFPPPSSSSIASTLPSSGSSSAAILVDSNGWTPPVTQQGRRRSLTVGS